MAEEAVLPIVVCGDPVLRQPAGEFTGPFGAQLADLVADMKATMRAAPGVGLAAPQVGVPLRVAVAEDRPELWGALSPDELAERGRAELPFTVMVNPELVPVEEDGFATFFEGCLSVPGLTAVVRRYRTVRVGARDEEGRPYSRVFSGWAARIAQHELDHLAGVLYLDRAEMRSLSTLDNYVAHWARGGLRQAADALGFDI
jgi:peptide deformylase